MSEDRFIHSFEEISPLEIPNWDFTIGSYETKTLFHETCWLRFLERSQGAKIRGLKLLDERGAVAGYFCAGEVRKGFFRLLGSPLQGWTTYFMGPIVNQIRTETLLSALERYYRDHRVDYVELANLALPDSAMRNAGYESEANLDFLITIDTETAMWARLSKTLRNDIRRARNNKLRVERATDGEFVSQYYTQLEDVFARQGLVPTYGVAQVQALWDCLMPAGRLLALRVLEGDEVIATGLFPFDERVIYGWGWAARVDKYVLRPYPLLLWSVICFALENKISSFNIGGGPMFKAKFGGAEVVHARWFKVRSPLVRVSRRVYKRYAMTRQRILGRLKHSFKRRPAASVAKA